MHVKSQRKRAAAPAAAAAPTAPAPSDYCSSAAPCACSG